MPQSDEIPANPLFPKEVLKSLPIGIQTFERLIEHQYLYVDKTAHIYQLIKGTPRYFLSRPRRFGKSLLLSTLESIFLGKREFFKGLAIEKMDYHWDTFPVIRLDISRANSENENDLQENLANLLSEAADKYELILQKTTLSFMFSDLIRALHKKTGKDVVVLIDEYDSPLVNHLHNPDLVLCLREILREFYRVTKFMDEYLKFVFVTGVTNFAKANMFSGLNHLHNITLNSSYATLCGYTEDEVKLYFSDRVQLLETQFNKSSSALFLDIKNWYNGYCFSQDTPSVYNPFSTLQFFEDKRFSNYWYQTGTPTFLVRLIQDTTFPQPTAFEHLKVLQKDFDTLIIEKPSSIPLLFQAGYLTIKRCIDEMSGVYELGYPNHEVKQSFLHSLLSLYSEDTVVSSEIYNLAEKIKQNDVPSFIQSMQVFFSQIPYEIHISKESYYQTVFYLILKLLGYFIHVEVHTNIGRVDSVLETSTTIYIIEFKLNGTAQDALDQIEKNAYAAPFLERNKKLILMGIEFNVAEKNISDWKIKEL